MTCRTSATPTPPWPATCWPATSGRAGYEVFFLTGTDEHGQKVEKAAQAQGEAPLELADRVVKRFQSLWEKLNISNTDFIRTTQERHKVGVRELFRKIEAKGDIYLGEYEDWYCTPCETFWTETQLMDGGCPDCGRPTEKLKEESYFFRMSKYQDALLRHIEANPDFIQPRSRRNEILSFVREGLRDLSISRTTFSWGIPGPGQRQARRLRLVRRPDQLHHRPRLSGRPGGQLRQVLARRRPRHRQGHPALPHRLLADLPAGRRPAAAEEGLRPRLVDRRGAEDEQEPGATWSSRTC